MAAFRSAFKVQLKDKKYLYDADEMALVKHPVPLRNSKVFLHLHDFNLSDMHIHSARLLQKQATTAHLACREYFHVPIHMKGKKEVGGEASTHLASTRRCQHCT